MIVIRLMMRNVFFAEQDPHLAMRSKLSVTFGYLVEMSL